MELFLFMYVKNARNYDELISFLPNSLSRMF